MAVEISSEDGQAIRKLIPLATIPGPHFEALCAEISIESAKKNTLVFKRGETNRDLFYLLSGEVSLQAEGMEIETIQAQSETARFALAHQIPRKIDAVACNDIRFLRLSTETLSYLSSLTYEEENSSMVIIEPEENSDDWMTTLLRSPIFRNLPPANLQKILMSLEEVCFEKDEIIIRQGDAGDYYYLIKTGQCLLTRKPSAHAKDIKLALLRASDTFGEDSLLSDKPRNVTITALNKVHLLRLSKENFTNSIKEPSLKYVDLSEMREKVSHGSIVLDVRSTEEFNKSHLEESISTPFYSLRMQLKTFNRAHSVIVVCNDGKTSEAAAFLLLRNKFKAYILKGGMNAVAPDDKKSPASFNIDDGIETTPGIPDKNAAESTTQNSEESSDKPLFEEINRLKKENEKLQLINQELDEKCRDYLTAKEEAEKQYRVLSKQTEKLKAVLDNLKKP